MCFKKVIKKSAFTSILGSDDGNGEVILVAFFERLKYFGQCFWA